MKKINKNKSNLFNKAKIEEKNGLTISYNKRKLEEILPNLISEISINEKPTKIDRVNSNYEDHYSKQLNQSSCESEELYNPRSIDFIRRCTTEEEAIEILDYLLKRNEITLKECNVYKNLIAEDGGLQKLINECGGAKKPGYYMRKYYKKFKTSKEFKKNKNNLI